MSLSRSGLIAMALIGFVFAAAVAAVISPVQLSVIECFETDGGVNYRSDRLILF